MTRSDRTGTRSLAAFLKFAGLSGAGWLLDALLLLALVSAAGWQPFHANIASSCTAALAVFMVSRQMVFQKASRALLLRVGAYLAYSLCLILAASAAVGALVQPLSMLTAQLSQAWAWPAATAVAKVVVTPPQLVLNFLVSRFLVERTIKHPL